MKERIREIMESEDYTPARFADTLDIGRAIVSHILNGRNNPSLDVISRILEAFPAINPDWLLFGTGNMYRGDNAGNKPSAETLESQDVSSTEKTSFDLFSQPQTVIQNEKQCTYTHPIVEREAQPVSNTSQLENRESREDAQLGANTASTSTEIIREKVVYKTLPDRKISQIIIYYDDNTFEVFNR